MGEILSIPISERPLGALIDESLEAIHGTRPSVVFACANPHSVMVAQKDDTFREALQNADQVVADGAGLCLMARIARINVGPRITGDDYFRALMTRLNDSGEGRVFFFGSSPETLETIGRRFATDFPRLTLCGSLAPPFRSWTDEENSRMLAQINTARPDVLWIGMTAPRQEKWAQSNRKNLKAPVIGSIGAVFDFFAETKARAPDWVSNLGFEWAYRLALEPNRLWRRTLISAPTFVLAVIRNEFRSRSPFS
ncbi:WecB/TagA/CpsF family glycosyltransferase [Thiorhodococcus fuscus]|uniref:WecB/TagA/CpsF family glycosyltransferase n=1 Tax=Thiorhodococcus fuscus TaxID=527200 RepID=A0ABW4Y519_9GAMM